jgi:hypothetical protein
MKRYRNLAIFVLALYAALLVGTSLHVHQGTSTINPDCQLCQISHTPLAQTVAPTIFCEGNNVHVYSVESEQKLHSAPLNAFLQRGPPIAHS